MQTGNGPEVDKLKVRKTLTTIDQTKSQSIINLASPNQLISDLFRSSEQHY